MMHDEVISVPADDEICSIKCPVCVQDQDIDNSGEADILSLDPTMEGETSTHADENACSAGDCSNELEFSLDDSTEDEFPNYAPTLLDHQDEELDNFLGELHSTMQEECYGDLADDFVDCVETLVDSVIDIDDPDSDELLNTSSGCNPDDEPIYPGSPRKLGVCMLLLSVFMVRYRLSDDTMQQLLVLIGLLLPDNSKLITSLYGLRKYLEKVSFLPEVQYYCSFCYFMCDKTATRCPNTICGKDLTTSGAVSYFVMHKLCSQLQTLFKRERFTNAIRSHRFDHYNYTRGNNKGCL